MKHTVLITALVLSIGTGAALAAGSHKGPKGAPFSFEDVDVNKDGQLTQAELQAHAEARFNATDTDKDGLVSEAELRARITAKMQERVDERVSRMMDRRDANDDGQLSQDEMKPKRLDRMMERVDADGDGMISEAEFEAMKAKHKKRHKNKDKS